MSDGSFKPFLFHPRGNALVAYGIIVRQKSGKHVGRHTRSNSDFVVIVFSGTPSTSQTFTGGVPKDGAIEALLFDVTRPPKCCGVLRFTNLTLNN